MDPLVSPSATASPPFTLASLIEAILTPSPLVFAVGITIVLSFPIIVHFLLIYLTPYSSLPSVVLLGPPGAGKTSLATLIERGPDAGQSNAVPETHTSQVPLVIELSASPGVGYKDAAGETVSSGGEKAAMNHTKFLLVDVPGHPKLRAKVMERLDAKAIKAAKTKAIVYVVDSAALSEQDAVIEAAEYLYSVLLALQHAASQSKSTPPTIPFLIAANKADLFTARPVAAVRAAMESELSRIRMSKSKGLLDSGADADAVGSEEQDDWLGAYGSQSGFTFDQMAEFGVQVDVLGGSVRGEGGTWKGIDSWWAWITDAVTA